MFTGSFWLCRPSKIFFKKCKNPQETDIHGVQAQAPGQAIDVVMTGSRGPGQAVALPDRQVSLSARSLSPPALASPAI